MRVVTVAPGSEGMPSPRPGRPGVIGLIPAAGRASRIAPLPCSKEVLPVGLREVNGPEGPAQRVQVACHCLLERLRRAGVERAYVVLGHGKWDIPAYLGDGSAVGVQLAYLTVADSLSAVYTVDRAYPFVADALIAFGFPDILFRPADAYDRLLQRQAATGADVVLGLFPTDRPDKADMVAADADGSVRRVVVKPGRTDLRLSWITAVWTPAFTAYLHSFTRERMSGRGQSLHGGELHIGDVLRAAIDDGVPVNSVAFAEGLYRDIGTPEDLAAALGGPPLW